MIRDFQITGDALSLLLRWRWSVLLGILIFTYVLRSVIDQSVVGEVISRLLYVVVFACAALAVDLPAPVSRLALCMVFFWPLVSLLNLVLDTHLLTLVELIVVATILIGCLIIVFYDLSQEKKRTEDAISGSMFGYLLAALVFALFYVKLEQFQPGSFNLGDADDRVSSLVYFSLVTITTLGFGDITPISRLARVVVGMEAATGIMYVAVFIGRIVARR